MTDSDNSGDNWLTPKEAADKYGLNERRVYRLLERGQVNAKGDKGQRRVNPADIENFLAGERAKATVTRVVRQSGSERGPRRPPPGEMEQTIGGTLLDLSRQRDGLARQLEDANHSRVKDAERIGRLEASLEAVEREAGRLRGDNEKLQKSGSRALTVFLFVVVLLVVTIALLALVR